MFTGIITDVGQVRSVDRSGEARFVFSCAYDADTIDLGASIACDGVCLTVVEKGRDANGNWFVMEVSEETLSKTTLASWAAGTRVNLERALKVGDELGGHIVSGHVDGVATVVEIRPDNESRRIVFEAPDALKKFVAPKGSVTINGVSLTVNEVDNRQFGINIIPHTQTVTTLGDLRVGTRVNMEIDMLARYVSRLLEKE